MIHSDPISWPGLIALGLGGIAFVASLLAARRRLRVAGEQAGGTRSRRSIAGITIQTVGIFMVGVGPIRPFLPAGSMPALVEAAIVASLMAGTFGLFSTASRALGRNWSLVARTRGDHQLVESGPFAHIRHPIYTALALFTLAIAVAYGHLSHLWLGAPFFIVGTWLRVAEEERLLRAMFGPAYDDYARRVKRFVPGIV